jgi:hypothetical protein
MTLCRVAKRAGAGKSQKKRYKLAKVHRRLQDGLSYLRERYMTKKHLWEHLQGFFPPDTAHIVQEAIYEIGSLEALRTWKPSFVNPPDVWKVVDWGIPLVQIKRMPDELTNLNPLRQKIGTMKCP